MAHNNVLAVILAAGKQERFGQKSSKMMVRIGNKVAFDYTISSIKKVLEEDQIVVVTSNLFAEFNQHLRTHYPKLTLIFDPNPGKGTLFSLMHSLPWHNQKIFVAEGDIYYDSSLVEALTNQSDCTIAITNKTNIAPTHRGVNLDPFTINDHGVHLNAKVVYRNMGVYLLTANTEKFWVKNQHTNLIDFIRWLYISNLLAVKPYLYKGLYLHTADKSDVFFWIKHLAHIQKNE